MLSKTCYLNCGTRPDTGESLGVQERPHDASTPTRPLNRNGKAFTSLLVLFRVRTTRSEFGTNLSQRAWVVHAVGNREGLYLSNRSCRINLVNCSHVRLLYCDISTGNETTAEVHLMIHVGPHKLNTPPETRS